MGDDHSGNLTALAELRRALRQSATRDPRSGKGKLGIDYAMTSPRKTTLGSPWRAIRAGARGLFEGRYARPIQVIIILVLAAILSYYPILFIRTKIYFMQDFASMTPQERIERFSWKMYVWRYRFSSTKTLLHLLDDKAEGLYGQKTFESLYPPGNPVDPLFAALSKGRGYCFEYSGRSLTRLLTPEDIRNHISLKLCGYLYIPSLYGIYPIPLFAKEWGVTIKYNTVTRKLIDYGKVNVFGDVGL